MDRKKEMLEERKVVLKKEREGKTGIRKEVKERRDGRTYGPTDRKF